MGRGVPKLRDAPALFSSSCCPVCGQGAAEDNPQGTTPVVPGILVVERALLLAAAAIFFLAKHLFLQILEKALSAAAYSLAATPAA